MQDESQDSIYAAIVDDHREFGYKRDDEDHEEAAPIHRGLIRRLITALFGWLSSRRS